MLTHSQLSQLAAAAWCGPALQQFGPTPGLLVSIDGYPGSPRYGVTYLLPGAGFGRPAGHCALFGSHGVACPFQAVTAAVGAWAAQAAAAAAFSGCAGTAAAVQRVVAHAATVVRQAARDLAGQCPACGESADPFGHCACEYVRVAAAHYCHV